MNNVYPHIASLTSWSVESDGPGDDNTTGMYV